VNYPALADEASWFNEAAIAASPQALLPAVPAVDFREHSPANQRLAGASKDKPKDCVPSLKIFSEAL